MLKARTYTWHPVLLAWLGLLAAGPGNSAMGPRSIEQLVQESDLIIVGQVIEVDANARDLQGEYGEARQLRVPVSVALVSVAKVIKGEAGGNTVRVEWIPALEDSPQFSQGQHAVLFLKGLDADGDYQTVAQSQGQFLIEEDRVPRTAGTLADFLADIRNQLH